MPRVQVTKRLGLDAVGTAEGHKCVSFRRLAIVSSFVPDVRRGFQLLGRERRWQRYFRGVKKDWMDQEVEKDSILAIGPRWRICSWSLWSRPLANGWLQPDIKI